MLHAFEKAGIGQLRIQLLIVAPQFSREDWIAIHEEAVRGKAAREMMEKGQGANAGNGQTTHADLHHPKLSEGHLGSADEGRFLVADAQSPMVEGGQLLNAPEGQKSVASLHQPKPDEGQLQSADNGHLRIADVRSPTPEGQGMSVREDHDHSADGQPIASGEAILGLPPKATEPVPPAREPDPRLIAAMARDRAQTNAIWLARTKTSDGRFWSVICPYEFDGMERDGIIASTIRRVYGPFNAKQMRTPLGDLITPALEKRIVRALEKRDAA